MKRLVTQSLALIGVAIIGLAPIKAAADTLAAVLADAYHNRGLIQQTRSLLRAAD